MSPRAVFVAGAHTDIGKTHVACALLEEARRQGLAVEVLKPVVSGFDPEDWADSDPGRLLRAAGQAADAETLASISPWRFAAPLAPPMAASLEGRAIPLDPVSDFCRRRLAASSADLFLVEGIGGLMSPIADRATGLDLMTRLALPSVLVGGTYLGAISHLLTALATLAARGLPVSAVVLSQSPEPAPEFADTLKQVRGFVAPAQVIAAPRDGMLDWPRAALGAVLR